MVPCPPASLPQLSIQRLSSHSWLAGPRRIPPTTLTTITINWPYVWWRVKETRRQSAYSCGAGADPTPALGHAATSSQHGAVDALKLLLDAGVNPNGVDECDNTPLEVAMEHEKTPAVVTLLKAGASPNGTHYVRGTALTSEAYSGQVDIVEKLLDVGVGPDLPRTEACALGHAAYKGFNSIAELLVARGADSLATDGNGRTPLQKALGTKNYSMAMLFRNRLYS